MRLIAHNSITCPFGKCRGFPLEIECVLVEQIEFRFTPVFIERFLSSLDYDSLKAAASQVGIDDMPASLPPIETVPQEHRESFLLSLHKVLLETHIMDGALKCPKCKGKFKIEGGRVNFMDPLTVPNSEDAEDEDDDIEMTESAI